MSREIGTFEVSGPAEPPRVRLAGWLDAAAALLITMLAWPFPVLWASLPWPVHGPLIVAGILLADMLVRTTALLVWGRTPFMYLLDLGFETASSAAGDVSQSRAGSDTPAGTRQTPGRAVRWAAGWTAALLPSLLGARGLVDPERGLPARASGLLTRSTR